MGKSDDVPPGTPIYQLLTACYMEDDTLHEEGEEIAYLGVPNEWMAPMNEPARIKVQELLERLDMLAREKAERLGRPWSGRPRDVGDQIAEARGDVRRKLPEVQIVTPMRQRDIPQRPDMIPLAQRKAKKTPLLSATKPDAPGKPQPRPISTHDADQQSNSS